jgi:hypothetical protein
MERNTMDAPIKGRIAGTAEVRDKDGNLKGTFTFGGDATEEQFNELQQAHNLTPGDDNGSNSDHSGP